MDCVNILSTKRECHSRENEKLYWKNLCLKNNELFLVQQSIWKLVFNEAQRDTIMIHDFKKRGFVIVKNTNPVEILFAFVSYEHRKKHILTKMFQIIRRKFPGKLILLESREEALIIWKKLGFLQYETSDSKSIQIKKKNEIKDCIDSTIYFFFISKQNKRV